VLQRHGKALECRRGEESLLGGHRGDIAVVVFWWERRGGRNNETSGGSVWGCSGVWGGVAILAGGRGGMGSLIVDIRAVMRGGG